MTETQALLREMVQGHGPQKPERVECVLIPRSRLIDLAKQLKGASAIIQTILNP